MIRRSDRMIHVPRAAASRGFVAPRYSRRVRRFMITVGAWYLRLIEGVSNIDIHNESSLMDELELFFANDHRLIIAFRHAAKEDAPVLMYALNRKLQRLARKRNRLKEPTERIIPHAQFLYGSDVLEWAGKAAAWLFPRVGCIPVQNRILNKQSLTMLRTQIQQGAFPIALAPEGQVTYHMYRCSEIAPGIASLAHWAAQSSQKVTILPVAIGYRHAGDQQTFIRSVLSRWQDLIGITLTDCTTAPILKLLLEATEHTVTLLESLYCIDPEQKAPASIRERILMICEAAMKRAENIAQISGDGTLLDRLFRLRYLGTNATRPKQSHQHQSPVIRRFADVKALEAHTYLHHTQLVDVLEYIDPDYIAPPCSAGRACEYALNLLDVTNRIQEGNINSRYSPRRKGAYVYIGKAIHLDNRKNQGEPPFSKNDYHKLLQEVQEALETTSLAMENDVENEMLT